MIMPNNCTFTYLENIADLRQLRNAYLCSYYDLRPGTRKYDINSCVALCVGKQRAVLCHISAKPEPMK